MNVWWMYRRTYVCMFIYMYILNVCMYALYAGVSM